MILSASQPAAHYLFPETHFRDRSSCSIEPHHADHHITFRQYHRLIRSRRLARPRPCAVSLYQHDISRSRQDIDGLLFHRSEFCLIRRFTADRILSLGPQLFPLLRCIAEHLGPAYLRSRHHRGFKPFAAVHLRQIKHRARLSSSADERYHLPRRHPVSRAEKILRTSAQPSSVFVPVSLCHFSPLFQQSYSNIKARFLQ